MNGECQNIQSFVDALNNSGVPYLVLRNYENLLSPEIYVDGHGDMICYVQIVACWRRKSVREHITIR